MNILENLKFNSDGLIPAVVQEESTGIILMVAYMNNESIKRTLETGLATYWSRSRQKFWVKGETSGHTQKVKGVFIDCDLDTLLIKVEQTGPACHEGYHSCFFREISNDGSELNIIAEIEVNTAEIYGKK